MDLPSLAVVTDVGDLKGGMAPTPPAKTLRAPPGVILITCVSWKATYALPQRSKSKSSNALVRLLGDGRVAKIWTAPTLLPNLSMGTRPKVPWPELVKYKKSPTIFKPLMPSGSDGLPPDPMAGSDYATSVCRVTVLMRSMRPPVESALSRVSGCLGRASRPFMIDVLVKGMDVTTCPRGALLGSCVMSTTKSDMLPGTNPNEECVPPVTAYRLLPGSAAIPVSASVFPNTATVRGIGLGALGSIESRFPDVSVVRRTCPEGRTCRFLTKVVSEN